MDLPAVDPAVSIQDRRGAKIPAELEFLDEDGKPVRMGDYFGGDRPIVLNLGYYGCPTLCGVVMRGMVDGLRDVRLRPGDYEIVSVSIDPKETPALARSKKTAFVAEWGEPSAEQHWHFLTSPGDSVRKLAETVGFGYQWNEFGKLWDHGGGIFLLDPSGVLTQTMYGTTFTGRDLRLALVEASQGKIGSAFDRLLLSCFGYNPETRSYTLLVWTVVRVGGTLTVLAIAALVIVLFRRERRRVVAATT